MREVRDQGPPWLGGISGLLTILSEPHLHTHIHIHMHTHTCTHRQKEQMCTGENGRALPLLRKVTKHSWGSADCGLCQAAATKPPLWQFAEPLASCE